MQLTYWLLLSAASLSQAWYHGSTEPTRSTEVATRSSPWRSLIQRDTPTLEKRLGPYFRCGHDLVWPATPTDDADRFAILNKDDLGNAQNDLIDACHNGTQFPVSGNGPGQVYTYGGVYVQYCNIGTNPDGCDPELVKKVFDQIQCGSQDAPQMGMGFATLDLNGAIPGPQPSWGVVFGPKKAQALCHTGS